MNIYKKLAYISFITMIILKGSFVEVIANNLEADALNNNIDNINSEDLEINTDNTDISISDANTNDSGVSAKTSSTDLKTLSNNIDVYIQFENVLTMSLDTNKVTFSEFNGAEDMEKKNAINITVNSTLPYSLNAYLETEIYNSDKSNVMDKSILNIKESGESEYKIFTSVGEKVILKDNNSPGEDLIHGIDLKLLGGITHEKDIYKTAIKFEVEQK